MNIISVGDGCSSNPCKNGVCKSVWSKYECNCYKGFQGVNCDVGKLELY